MTDVEPGRSPDLGVVELPILEWGTSTRQEALAALYEWSGHLATEAITWYMTEKRRKARWSRTLRRLTAILLTLGGAVPVAALGAGVPVWGNWGFVLLALAGGCLTYDRFFGYSSAWLRYVAAATRLRAELATFQLAWATAWAERGDDPVTAEDSVRFIELVRDFSSTVNEIIQAETESWLVEFHTRLSELESRLQQPPSGQESAIADADSRVGVLRSHAGPGHDNSANT